MSRTRQLPASVGRSQSSGDSVASSATISTNKGRKKTRVSVIGSGMLSVVDGSITLAAQALRLEYMIGRFMMAVADTDCRLKGEED